MTFRDRVLDAGWFLLMLSLAGGSLWAFIWLSRVVLGCQSPDGS